LEEIPLFADVLCPRTAMKTAKYLNEHNVIELLKNQLTLQHLANQENLGEGLRYIISVQTQSLSAIAQRSGINVEQVEAELRDEVAAGVQDIDKGMDKYFGNVNRRTGMTRAQFNRAL